MLLKDLKHGDTYVQSFWELTYPASWEAICKAAYGLFDYYDSPEILLMNNPIQADEKDKLLSLSESMNLTIRGVSKILKVPVSICFYNQLKNVSVTVIKLAEEYKNADYRSLNLSLGQYLDSIELLMHK